MSFGRSVLLVAACALAACASTSNVPPRQPDHGGIAIRVKVRAPVRIISQRPSQVLFVRLSGPGGSVADGELVPSNHEQDGYVFLLNALPGTYVAVTCFKDMERAPVTVASSSNFSVSFRPSPSNYTTYFPEEMIRQTEVIVPAGGIAFMGEYVVDQSVGLKGADPTQLHFYSRFGDGDEDEGLLENAFGGDYHYRGALHESTQDEEARADFREACDGRLVEAGWSPVTER